MTDFPPKSALTHFGVSYAPRKLTWAYLDGNFEVVEHEFRVHPGFSFDEQMAFQASLSLMQSRAQIDQDVLIKKLNEVQERMIAGEVTEEHTLEVAEAETRAALDAERERYVMVVEQTLMLVHPHDREALEPLLTNGNATDVRLLRGRLMDIVINRVKDEVQAVGQVDPT